MYCNNILHFQASATILNASTKKSVNLLKAPPIYIYIYIYIYMHTRREDFVFVNHPNEKNRITNKEDATTKKRELTQIEKKKTTIRYTFKPTLTVVFS